MHWSLGLIWTDVEDQGILEGRRCSPEDTCTISYTYAQLIVINMVIHRLFEYLQGSNKVARSSCKDQIKRAKKRLVHFIGRVHYLEGECADISQTRKTLGRCAWTWKIYLEAHFWIWIISMQQILVRKVLISLRQKNEYFLHESTRLQHISNLAQIDTNQIKGRRILALYQWTGGPQWVSTLQPRWQ